MQTSYNIPGVYFEEEPPQQEDVLPRMDIAAFVGFAGKGPLNTPVPVEDAARFRDIFGDDVPLAWNLKDKGFEYSHLGPSVEAFFRNGGRRCWVVRVADEKSGAGGILTHRFSLRALHRISDQNGSSFVNKAEAAARCGGRWAKDLRVGTALQTNRLVSLHDDPALCFQIDTTGYRLDVTSIPADLKKGDLLEISFIRKNDLAEASPEVEPAVLLAFADETISLNRGIRIRGKKAFWISTETLSTPAPLFEVIKEGVTYYIYSLAASAQLSTVASPPTEEPELALKAQILRFELLVWEKDILKYRLGDLCFHPRHPRFWGNLPDDEELFRFPGGKPSRIDSPDIQSFLKQAAGPRFPLAGTGEGIFNKSNNNSGICYLPIGMESEVDLNISTGPEHNASGDGLAVDGLANFDLDLFVDRSLISVVPGNLKHELERDYYIENKSLKGIYCLLPIEEATIVAVPDLVHRRWTKDVRVRDNYLSAPELQEIPDPDDYGYYELNWTKVDDATGYIVQRDNRPEFDNPVSFSVGRERLTRYEDSEEFHAPPDTRLSFRISRDCGGVIYFRVRAIRYGEASPWSNSKGRIQPAEEFIHCGKSKPEILETSIELSDISSPPDSTWICWSPRNSGFDDNFKPDKYELQEAKDIEFESAKIIYHGGQNGIIIKRHPDSIFFYRVRAGYGNTIGPWSNTVYMRPYRLSTHVLEEPEDYNNEILIAVHRALINFCAARGDMVAILSVPRHYRKEHLMEHITALSSMSSGQLINSSLNSDDNSPAFTAGTGDERALSYAALYHPWPAIAFDIKNRKANSAFIHFYPPEGTVCGVIAKMSLERGAWIATANQPLRDVVALDPEFTQENVAELIPKKINVLVRDPRGFLAWSAETLSQSSELQPLHVRRLLILLRRIALREGNSYVFDSNSTEFRDDVYHYFDRLLMDLYLRGAFSGTTANTAYRVVTGPSVNTRQSLDLGRLIVELRISPAQALGFLSIRLIQTDSSQLVIKEL